MSSNEREQILLQHSLTRAFLEETPDTRVWVEDLYPHWLPIDNRLKEAVGDDWQMLITMPIIQKGITPIELGRKIHLLDPTQDPALHNLTVNYALFIGYELGDQLKILNVLPDVLSMLERRGASVSIYSTGYRALVGVFIRGIMNTGSGIRQTIDNPVPHSSIEDTVAELLERELGIIRPI